MSEPFERCSTFLAFVSCICNSLPSAACIQLCRGCLLNPELCRERCLDDKAFKSLPKVQNDSDTMTAPPKALCKNSCAWKTPSICSVQAQVIVKAASMETYRDSSSFPRGIPPDKADWAQCRPSDACSRCRRRAAWL